MRRRGASRTTTHHDNVEQLAVVVRSCPFEGRQSFRHASALCNTHWITADNISPRCWNTSVARSLDALRKASHADAPKNSACTANTAR